MEVTCRVSSDPFFAYPVPFMALNEHRSNNVRSGQSIIDVRLDKQTGWCDRFCFLALWWRSISQTGRLFLAEIGSRHAESA
eukprot:m.251358 g.251358  ORF g.251358 m.251358 type:complete len:81 (+) comp40335_c0_seq7:90-332(+)